MMAWIACLLGLLIKGGLMSRFMLSPFDVDFVTVIVAYILIHHGKTGAAVFALSQGFVIDIYSAGLLGLFTVIYLLVFIGMNFGSRFFEVHTARGVVLLVWMAVALKGVLFLAFLNTFALEIAFSSTVFITLAASTALSGLVAPVLFLIFRKVSIYTTSQEAETI